MFAFALILVPLLEVLAFIEVGRSIGWVPALALLLLTSILGGRLLRIQGRSAITRVSRAASERREPGRAAIDGLLGFLGAALLAIPGFVTDVLGAILLLPPSRRLVGRRLSRHYGGRAMRICHHLRTLCRGRSGAAPRGRRGQRRRGRLRSAGALRRDPLRLGAGLLRLGIGPLSIGLLLPGRRGGLLGAA